MKETWKEQMREGLSTMMPSKKKQTLRNTGGLLLIYGIATAWRKKGGGKDA